ncbi:hypothetical protein BBJ29_002502 [Phytophthora kernoviae]|uniref:Uncharacterized protein n=1 Tax=Phytophthora kernoviae TaxID=325452 RepID=A0A3F2RQS4_9STRA|nr:hypothetical protein BBJ29_002502 [Phytophthora kernoviae]RLN61575.1 hypothetical protein BBP00_00005292 [Phytophthora kernoviae]
MMVGNEIFNDLNLMLRLNHHIQSTSVTPEGIRLLTPASSSSSSASLEKKTSFKVLTDLESVTSSDSREDAQFDHQRSVFLSLCSSDLPFHLQGDKDFNEASAMAKRRALRFSESIKARIEFLWEVAGGKKQAEMAQRIRHQQQEEQEQGRSRLSEQSVRRAGATNGIRPILPSLEELDEEDYMALMLLIFKALRDDFVLELAYKQIQCDWEVDSHHGKTLSFEQFAAAIFELVDVWTCDIEEVTYVRFLDLLSRRITRRVVVFLDGAELKLSLSDNFESDIVVKSIPLRTIPKFVTVARVVAATGMRTVGELAHADPKVVERERVEFLQRNNGGVVPTDSEMRKIGQDLQTLLAMFKSIASQFENINYTLDNNTGIESIRAELTKFNVGITASMLPEKAARDRYNALYDMLVLRDGESLKTLAGVMLEQIKLQLNKYGIVVDDEEHVEEVYDAFFESVLSGNGDSIVQDAQRWMEGTVQDNKVNDYIQHGFHELSSVNEVELLGTKNGDEEFLALLTKDTDVIDEVIEDSDDPVPGQADQSSPSVLATAFARTTGDFEGRRS